MYVFNLNYDNICEYIRAKNIINIKFSSGGI